jgi:hypothetical protein
VRRAQLLFGVGLVSVVFTVSACVNGSSEGSGIDSTGGVGLPANAERIGRADLGKSWPFTVDAGVLKCEGAGEVTFTAGGTTYAVNGTATGADNGVDIKPIWKKDPDFPGLRINIGPIITRGLKLCT